MKEKKKDKYKKNAALYAMKGKPMDKSRLDEQMSTSGEEEEAFINSTNNTNIANQTTNVQNGTFNTDVYKQMSYTNNNTTRVHNDTHYNRNIKSNPSLDNNIETFTQNTNTNQNHFRKTFEQLIFTEQDNGPIYKIMLEKVNINEISTGVLLKKLNITGIEELKKINRNRIQITMNSKKEANKILTNQTLERLHQIRSFIPKSFVISVGIVKDVPLDLSTEDLELNCNVSNNKVKIHSVERLTYWDKEKKEVCSSRNVKIEFRSPVLPKEVFLFYVKKTVDHYIPKPILCRKCIRYGHVEKICSATNKKLCVNCTEETHAYTKGCECDHCTFKCLKKCKFCNTHDHNALQACCPENKKQILIKKEMIINNKNFMEAKDIVEQQIEPKITQSYANVTNMNKQIDEIKKELDNLREINKKLIERVATAEILIDKIHTNTEIIENSPEMEPVLGKEKQKSKTYNLIDEINNYNTKFNRKKTQEMDYDNRKETNLKAIKTSEPNCDKNSDKN